MITLAELIVQLELFVYTVYENVGHDQRRLHTCVYYIYILKDTIQSIILTSYLSCMSIPCFIGGNEI